VQGNTAAAKEFYQQANLLEPTETNRYFLNQANNMQAYGQAAVGAFLAGYEKYQLGDKAGALSGFEQAIQQSPNWLEAWRWVGRIRLELDRPKEALTAWQQVALSPQVTAADRYFLRLAELSSKYGAPAAKTFFEGMGLYQAGKKPEAQARFLAATQANLQFVEAWYWLGRVAFEQNNFQLALTAFGEVLKLEPDNKDAQYWLIQAKRPAR
jgi:tetratricopeptide (TPR) repeat protein